MHHVIPNCDDNHQIQSDIVAKISKFCVLSSMRNHLTLTHSLAKLHGFTLAIEQNWTILLVIPR